LRAVQAFAAADIIYSARLIRLARAVAQTVSLRSLSARPRHSPRTLDSQTPVVIATGAVRKRCGPALREVACL